MAAPQDQELINSLVDQQLGAENVAAAEQATAGRTAQDAQQAAVAQKAQEVETPTAEDQAQSNSPVDESDKQAEEAITFIDVDFQDGQDPRRLSDKQVRDTMNRYKNLNFLHSQEIAPMKPAIEFINQTAQGLRQQGHNVSGDDMAQFLKAATDAFVKNVQMGGQVDPTPDSAGVRIPKPQVPADIEAEFTKWEEENAVNLPPMYRDAANRIGSLEERMGKIGPAMEQMMSQAQGLSSEAATQAEDANTMHANAVRQQAANNLSQAQRAHNLPDEEEADFFNFAFERGYTIDDFIDPQMTNQIVSDYSAARNTPEMERLQSMAQRRQSYTGTVDLSPSSGGTPPEQNVDQQFIDTLTDQAYQKRNLTG